MTVSVPDVESLEIIDRHSTEDMDTRRPIRQSTDFPDRPIACIRPCTGGRRIR